MQQAQMRRIEETLDHLDVLAMDGGQHVRRRQAEPSPAMERRPQLSGTQIDSDKSAGFFDWIGFRPEVIFEFRVRYVRRIQDGAVGCELPAMIDAAYAATFDAAKRQRSAAMAAGLVEKSDTALGVANGDESLA